MSTIHPQPSTDEVFGCDELPCVDVGVGIMHHPYCGMRRDDPDMISGPDTPEDEEMLPPDPARAV